jgi:hypothetical protein
MRRGKAFLLLSGLGLAGILSLVPTLGPALGQIRGMPDASALPDAALIALLLLQPALLLLAAVAIGIALAERAGLTSLILCHCIGKAPFGAGKGWLSSLVLAALAGSAAAAADLTLRGLFPASFMSIPRLDDVTLAQRAMALLYGGITEELLMRFGLMTLLVWIGTRLLGGRRPSWLVWAAIALASLAFAAGHLPALLGMGQPDTVLILRTLGLNAALGFLYGWLYAARSLEHAMLAHAATHVMFWTATPFLAFLGS